MLWPVIVPFKIAFWSLTALVAFAVVIAPLLKWKTSKTFLVSTLLALVAFVPSCTGIMYVVDGMRFGNFEYATFADVKDFRAERYLPRSAAKIKMQKHANGYRAQYLISDASFHAYLDSLWNEYGKYSVVKRGEMSGDGEPASREELEHVFSDLGWNPLENAIEYYSPTEADGGGATYYYDASDGVAYQRTGYW